MKKYIHYCWFGGKPLPKLAKKCIKSWKKYLPDFEIIEWNEKNFDINMTNFSKHAYEEKKWAFVSDVARIYALKEYGGIYFDTDMIVTKNVDKLLDDELFAGWESEFNVAVGVLYSKNKNHPLINKLWNFYSENDFDEDNMFSFSIPTLLGNILKTEYGLKYDHLNNQLLKDGIMIYARDYFYPISCLDTNNMFTENTCMIHYYIGSWLPMKDKKRIQFEMIFGKKIGNILIDILVWGKHTLKNIAKIILYPYVVHRRNKYKESVKERILNTFNDDFNNYRDEEYIVFYNNNWLGTKNSTKELFDNVIGIEQYEDVDIINSIAKIIAESNIKLVVFSAFAYGWDQIVEKIKELNPDIVIKVIWHGSNAMNVESYDFDMFKTIFNLLDKNVIRSICFVKKSMYDFYKLKGYNVEFIYNTVYIDKSKINKSFKKLNGTKIGLYASGDRWVKNFYNQLGAASLFKNVRIDCVPINYKTEVMSKVYNVVINGLQNNISREKLLERMADNDINFYVTFSECAPLIPLESFELGVPCITGNNHHYWDGTELEKYLIVDKADDVLAIYNKAKYCLENKEIVMKLYNKWKKDYDKLSEESINKFLNWR